MKRKILKKEMLHPVSTNDRYIRSNYLRILKGKMHRQIKLQRLQKVRTCIWVADTSNQLFKAVTGKIPFFVIGPFCSTILFVLPLASDMAILWK